MCSYLLGSQRCKQASWLQEASGILSSRNQRSRDQLFGFGAEQLDPVSEHLLNATPRALLGRMGGWEGAVNTSPGLIIIVESQEATHD